MEAVQRLPKLSSRKLIKLQAIPKLPEPEQSLRDIPVMDNRKQTISPFRSWVMPEEPKGYIPFKKNDCL